MTPNRYEYPPIDTHEYSTLDKIMLGIFACILIGVGVLAYSSPAEARGGVVSARPSFSAPRPSVPTYRAPAPVYKAPAPIVSQRSTVINRTTVVQSAPSSSSSGGFFSNFISGFAGGAAASWLFNDNDKPAPAPQYIDCSAEANKGIPGCQPK